MRFDQVPGGAGTIVVGGVAVLAIGYVLMKRAGGDTRPVVTILAEDAARGAVSGVANAADGVVTGTVKGIAGSLGIPDTDAARCEQAKKAGNAWEASLYCKAGDFATWSAQRVLSGGKPTPTTKPGAQDQVIVRPAAKPTPAPTILKPGSGGMGGSFGQQAGEDFDIYGSIFGKTTQ